MSSPWSTSHTKSRPVELGPIDPQRRELRQVPISDARLDFRSRLALQRRPGYGPLLRRVAPVAIGYRPVPGDVGPQRGPQFSPALDDERNAFLHGLAADLQRVLQLRQTRFRDRTAATDLGFEELEQPFRLLDQPLIVPRRQRDQALVIRTASGRGVESGTLVFLDDDMRVGAAESERAHADAPRQFPPMFVPARRPDLISLNDVERAVGQINLGIQSLEIDRRRNRTMSHSHQDLDESGQSRRALQMPDIGLDGPKSAL